MDLNPSYSLLDLFAGAGGFSLGFTLNNFSLQYALEIDEWASSTIAHNNPATSVITSDIRDYQSPESIKAVVGQQTFDLIIGGPPCQGFSIAGPKKDPKDPRNSLFVDFSRWVDILRPRVFVIENVKGIVGRKNANDEKVVDIIKNTFYNLGYSTELWIMNAVNYGVPQFRERVFFVGNRFGIEMGIPPCSHFEDGDPNLNNDQLHYVTVGQAILDLPIINASEGADELEYTIQPSNDYQSWARGNQTILFNHEAMKHTQRIIDRFSQIKCGESLSNISIEGYGAKKRNGNGASSESTYDMNNRRLDPIKPSFTIPASFYSTFIHPALNRNITAREAARIQSFPDFYRFMGKRTVISSKLLQRQNRHDENHLSQYNQIGNAVPPLLANAIAKHIRMFLPMMVDTP
ncbi:MAG: DNA cytosine methyltransferase [Chloroflexota bacterium]|jgi:DNA (cytosine-5)-methyltransferase 1